jgi:Reverse transcriptase (RNA-dependent DNA polymerase)
LDLVRVQFDIFEPVTTDEVTAAINHLPKKFSAADPLTTSILKQVAHIVVQFITQLFNRSLRNGQVPTLFKCAFVTPLIKKNGLDPTATSSYRPISNLSVLSKLLERLVAKRLQNYLHQFCLLPSLQSGFRAQHFTESATLPVLSDLLTFVDRGDLGLLALLDLSAARSTPLIMTFY